MAITVDDIYIEQIVDSYEIPFVCKQIVHVDPTNGLDSNSGTPDSPFLTLSAAWAAVSALDSSFGRIIYVQSIGDYGGYIEEHGLYFNRTTALIAGRDGTHSSYNWYGGTVWYPSVATSGWYVDFGEAGYIRGFDFKLRDSSAASGFISVGGVTVLKYNSFSWEGSTPLNSDFKTIDTTNADYIEFSNNRLYNMGTQAIYINRNQNNDGVVIRDNLFQISEVEANVPIIRVNFSNFNNDTRFPVVEGNIFESKLTDGLTCVGLTGSSGAFIGPNKFNDAFTTYVSETNASGTNIYYNNETTGAQIDYDAVSSAVASAVSGAVVSGIFNETITKQKYDIPKSFGKIIRIQEATWAFAGEVITAGPNWVQLDSPSIQDGAYDPASILVTDGTGQGQYRIIFEYYGSSPAPNGMTGVAYLDRNWKVIPDATTEVLITEDGYIPHVNEGVCQGDAGLPNGFVFNTLATTAAAGYAQQLVFIRSGPGEDQVRMVQTYDGAAQSGTVYHDWDVAPVSGESVYCILPYGRAHVESFDESAASGMYEINTSALSAYGLSGVATETSVQAISAGGLDPYTIIDPITAHGDTYWSKIVGVALEQFYSLVKKNP